MIEKIVLDYLSAIEFKELVLPDEKYLIIQGKSRLAVPTGKVLDVPCYAERPEEEPNNLYLVVEKTGSDNENHLQDATVAISSYGKTLYEAAALNEEVKRAMLKITRLSDVSAVRLNSDYNFTSTAAKCYRYQAVFVLTYYEEGQYV